MTFVHISDLHIGKSLHECSLLEDQRFYLEQLCAFLQDIQADALIIAGDLYDRATPPGEAVGLFDRFLTTMVAECKIPVLCIGGNHDSPSRLGFASGLYRSSGLYMAAQTTPVIDKVILSDRYGDVNFYLLPYLSPAMVRLFFPEAEIKTFDDAYRVMMEANVKNIDFTQRNVLVAHGFFMMQGHAEDAIRCESEIAIGTAEMVDAGLFSAFDYVALGHLHSPQSTGAEHIRYSGSPLKYSVSEAIQRKGALVVTMGEKGDVQTETYVLKPFRDLRVVEGSMDEILAGEASDDYIYARILSNQPILNAAEKVRNIYPNMIGLHIGGEKKDTVFMQHGGETARRTVEENFALFMQDVAEVAPTEKEAAIVAAAVADVRKSEF